MNAPGGQIIKGIGAGCAVLPPRRAARASAYDVSDLRPRHTRTRTQRRARVGRVAEDADSLRLVVVEDEDPVRGMIVSMLERDGHEVLAFAAAEPALAALRAEPGVFDLVITDVRLAGRSGAELARDLQRAGLRVPVLMISGESAPREAAHFLAKPFTAAQLRAAIGEILYSGSPSAS